MKQSKMRIAKAQITGYELDMTFLYYVMQLN